MLFAALERFDLASMGLPEPGTTKGLGFSRSSFRYSATTMMTGFFIGAVLGGVLVLWTKRSVRMFEWRKLRSAGDFDSRYLHLDQLPKP